MLNIWSVCVGNKYSDDYVIRLKKMVERNITTEHRFICLSDRAIEGVECFITPVDWPGWWQKLYLFTASNYYGGFNLYFDLDVVIVGDVTRLVSAPLSMPKNWARSGHGGCQSSVMSWGIDCSTITRLFDPTKLSAPANGNYGYYGDKSLWGDQEFITDVLGEPGEVIEPMYGIYSYKYHCLNGPPDDAKVVCFHGSPKPHEVNEKWVKDARGYTL